MVKKPLTLDQVKAIIDKSDAPDATKRQRKNKADQMVHGKMGVYCTALRKKVNISPGTAKMYAVSIGKGRSAIFLEGTSPKCITKAGKKTSARTILANVLSSAVTGRASSAPKRAKSRSRSRSKGRKRSKSRSKSRSKKRKRSKSRSRSRSKRRR